jgi:hypothetical protein
MNALAPSKQLEELVAAQRSPGSLPSWFPLSWPACREEFVEGKPQREHAGCALSGKGAAALRIEAEDLARFEGEGGLASPESAAAYPKEGGGQ